MGYLVTEVDNPTTATRAKREDVRRRLDENVSADRTVGVA
jgi:hypothetical protein